MSPRHDALLSLADGHRRLALTGQVGITGPDSDSRTTWIHVAPAGEWSGHSEGQFTLGVEHFKAVRSVIAAKATPVSVDYEHASIRPKGEPTPAAGYVLATEIRDDGLWALVEFTTRAAGMIKGGEYRFCSGVFNFSAADPVTGEPLLCVLDSIGLTNRPFIDGQQPIVLSRVFPLATGAPMKITLKALFALLNSFGVKEMSAAQLKSAIDLLSADDAAEEKAPPAAEDVAATAKAAGIALTAEVALADPAPAEAVAAADPMPAAPMVAADPPMADVDAGTDAKLMQATGLDEAGLDAAILANFDAIVALLMGDPTATAASVAMTRDLTVSTLRTSLADATRRLNEYVAKENAATAVALTAEVDVLIKEGKAHPSKRSEMVALARKSPADFRALASMLTPTLPVAAHGSALDTHTSASEGSTPKLAKDHPRVLALGVALRASRVDEKTIAAKLAELTG